MSKIFIVSCYCIAETDIILLEFLLSVQEKQTGNQWQLASDLSGDIVIINTDEKAGIEMYEKMMADENSPVIITYTTDSSVLNPEYHLNRPMRSADYISLTKKLLEDHPEIGSIKTKEAKQIKTENTATIPEETKTPAINFDIKRSSYKRLYNLLTEDSEKYNKPIQIIYREISIYIDFSHKRFFSEHKLILLSMLFKENIDSLIIKEISDDELNKIEAEIKPCSLEELLWSCTLLGSSGELIEKINKETLLHLKRWPNLQMLLHLPRHLTLTAFMTKYTATLGEIITQTNVLPENVIDFINACQVMGYLNIDEKNNSTVQNNIRTNTKRQSLFEKIRNKFDIKT